MTQEQRLDYLIDRLRRERADFRRIEVPTEIEDKRQLLRGLMNVRPPRPVSEEFLAVQDEYLRARQTERGVTRLADLAPVQEGLYLWRGDITTLEVDAIVNAANSRMLGCFVPCHACIDNVIHTYAGIQLRLACAAQMEGQGDEPTGSARITPAYNLPSRYVLHTVGPIITDRVGATEREQLASCYRACLALAAENGLRSIAFCCISTGVFHFPNDLAAEIAVQTVRDYRREHPDQIEVIFNVFTEKDHALYRTLLAAD